MSSFKGKVAVVGIGEVPTGVFKDRPCLQSALEVSKQAIEDAGIKKNEIDVIMVTGSFHSRQFSTNMLLSKMVEELGLQGIVKSNIQVCSGGSTSSSWLMTACGLITAGLSKCVLCVHSDALGSAPFQETLEQFAAAGISEEWETPYGFFMGALGSLVTTRYMYETGATPEQLASVVISMRKWAALNPNAMLRRQLTIEEVLGSKMVVTPCTTRMGNLFADGAAAFIVTSTQRAKDVTATPVYPIGFGSVVHHYCISQVFDITKLGYEKAAKEAFDMAGIKAKDVDIAEIYDSYPIIPLIALEGMGFCKRGEAGAFVYEGNTWPGGKLPMTTNGGMLAQGHSGAGGGVAVLVEAFRQLMGKAGERQVKDARIAVETSTGGAYMDSHVTVLGREIP